MECNVLNTTETPTRPTMAELRDMPKTELSRYLKKVQKAHDEFPDRKSAEVFSDVKKLLDASGVTLEEFVAYLKKEGKIGTEAKKVRAKGKRKAKAPKKPSAPKYRSPEDPNVTWTGKGRRPDWFKEHVANGGAPEALKVA